MKTCTQMGEREGDNSCEIYENLHKLKERKSTFEKNVGLGDRESKKVVALSF